MASTSDPQSDRKLEFWGDLCVQNGQGPRRLGPDNWIEKVTPTVISNFLFCVVFVVNIGTVLNAWP